MTDARSLGSCHWLPTSLLGSASLSTWTLLSLLLLFQAAGSPGVWWGSSSHILPSGRCTGLDCYSHHEHFQNGRRSLWVGTVILQGVAGACGSHGISAILHWQSSFVLILFLAAPGVFVLFVQGLSLAASRATVLSLPCWASPFTVASLVGSPGSRCMSFSSCGARAQLF